MAEEKLGYYTFCAINSAAAEEPLGAAEIEGMKSELEVIPYKGYGMVTAKFPIKIYHPKKDNLAVHQQVVAGLMDKYTVIPMSFGNIFETKDDITYLLEHLYDEFLEIFPKIENKIEIGLKVIGKKEWLEKEIHENEKVVKLKEKIKGKSENAAYYDRIQLGEYANNFINEKKDLITKEIFLPLANIADSSKQNDLIGERMLLNGSFLVDRESDGEFDKLVNELYEKWNDKADFKYTGPWPAYSFIDIKLKAREAQ
ncbi:GvpL/GvpF family gas vesicle protein [Metabacillus sp. GX 13764]|uniref:GvpL/GvpF family gas vesicle protein n=1 Tax=Metabacillus kandeliae TaxID=2900151 RepID=UPI001E35BAC4|nr:GvpL/GvpF family gas vesicle protein [Metabacillus kandeliae]MCD7033533.1 GvpL/GvpF family gas vesicle protein [Metabacillus kandeliae]